MIYVYCNMLNMTSWLRFTRDREKKTMAISDTFKYMEMILLYRFNDSWNAMDVSVLQVNPK